MWNELCDDAHEAQSLKLIHRTVMAIAVLFLGFVGVAIATRFGASAPPSSVSYGTEKAHPTAAVLGD